MFDRRLLIQLILALGFMGALLCLRVIYVSDAKIVYNKGKQRVDSSGVSLLLKPLRHRDIFDFKLISTELKNPNPHIAKKDISLDGFHDKFDVSIITSYRFHEGEALGYVDYQANLAPRGYITMGLLYAFAALLSWSGFSFRELFNLLRRYQRWILYAAICVCFYCVIINVSRIVVAPEASYTWFNDSGDMQWYPSVLFWATNGFERAFDPYKEALSYNVFLSNAPNYGHLLYILMYPFALLPFDTSKVLWAMFNEVCVIVVFCYIYKLFKDRDYPILYFSALLILFFISKTHTWSITRGQISLVMTLLALLAYYYRNNTFALAICLSVLLSKYSFGLAIALGFFAAGYIQACVLAGIITLACVAIFAYRFDLGFIEMALQPLRVSAQYAFHNRIDLYTFLKSVIDQLYVMIPIFLCSVVIWLLIILIKKPDKRNIIVSSIFLSLSIFPHHLYDYAIALACLFIFLDMRVKGRELYLALFMCFLFLLFNPTIFHSISCYIYCLYLVWIKGGSKNSEARFRANSSLD